MSSPPPAPSSHWAKTAEEEDRVEKLIRDSGCWNEHSGVVECMSEGNDWRKCQKELGEFRTCMLKSQLANKKKAEEEAAALKAIGIKN